MATITVTTLDDTVNSYDTDISLREAVTIANADAAADVIEFAPGLNGTMRMASTTLLSVNNDLTINGDNRITITGDVNADDTLTATGMTDVNNTAQAQLNDNSAIFAVYNGASFTLNGMTITGGHEPTYSGGAVYGQSGTTITITDSYFAGNSTSLPAGNGGAIYASGIVNITNSTFADNHALGANGSGGAILGGGTTTLNNVTLVDNSAGFFGGGIANSGGTLILNNVTITGNTSGSNGGGVFSNATETITNSLIIGNEATTGQNEVYGGGAVFTGTNIIGENVGDFDSSVSGNVINGTSSDIFATTTANGASTAGVLGDNGGPVPTVALKLSPTNAAIDRVTSSFSGDTANGVDRTINLFNIGSGGFADIGAFEVSTQVATGPVPVFNVNVAENTTSILTLDFFHPVDSVGAGIFMTPIFTTDQSALSLNGTTGELSFAAAPDFENPGDFNGDNTYTFQVAVFDSNSLFNVVQVNATVTNAADADPDALKGTSAGEVINGLGGDDTILGRGGNDTLFGDTGNDLVNGGGGNDQLAGGSENDTLIGGTGKDQISGEAGRDLLQGNGGDDKLIGGTQNDTLVGAGGKDMLLGDGGKDSLSGGGANDTLIGGSGQDTLKGGDGKDLLDGGLVKDVLTGNTGADIFFFANTSHSGRGAAKRDVITDFRPNSDKIDVSDIDAKTGSGNQAFTFIGSSKFSGTKGELRFQKTGGKTLVQGDTNGDKVADLEIELSGLKNLDAGDFVL